MSSRRAAGSIDRLVRDRAVSKEARDWLIAAIDPFHDQELSVKGYPDLNISPSVVQLVKQSVTVSSPDSTPTANWNAHVFSLPIMDRVKVAPLTQLANTLSNQTGTTGILGTLSCTSSSSSANLPISTAEPLIDLSNYSASACRVIAMGYEIVNNTAEIYKQGQITAYRQPQTDGTSMATYQFTASTSPYAAIGAASLRTLSSPPATQAEAMLLSGSRQWAAAEGAYVPLTLSSSVLPVTDDATAGMIFDPDASFTSTTTLCSAWNNVISGSVCYTTVPTGPVVNFNTGGVFLTGLSPQTSFTVTLNAWIEVFPRTSDTALVVLASPSPRYDMVAQEIYSECLADMPVAVMVKENGLGDWFKNAVTKVSAWAGPALAAIPHPVAQGAAMALRGVNQMVERQPGYTAQAPPNSKLVSGCSEDEIAAIKALLREKRRAKKAKRAVKPQ